MHWDNLKTSIEIAALVFGLLFPIFTGKGYRLGWLLGGLSSFLNGLIAFASGYYLDVLLNAFYIGISLLSFLGWSIKEHTFQSMSWKKAGIWLLVPGLLAAMYHPISKGIPGAELGFADGLTTFYSLAATLLLSKKIQWAWLIFVPINLLSAYMYYNKEFHFIALQFLVLTGLGIWAFYQWKREK